ncbi:hypothetical protein [Rurimicrobium arvi]
MFLKKLKKIWQERNIDYLCCPFRKNIG